jgi:hypothetical protein
MEKKITRRSLNKDIKAVFGMTYSVDHSGGLEDTVESEHLVEPWNFKIDQRRKVISASLRAFSGKKGNVVNLEIPFSGISALAKAIEFEGDLADLTKLKKWDFYIKKSQ